MSQSRSGGLNGAQNQDKESLDKDHVQTSCQNGRPNNNASLDNAKPDKSVGFEKWSTDNELNVQVIAPPPLIKIQVPTLDLKRQSLIGQSEERHTILGQLPPPPYQDNPLPGTERVPYLPQGGTQTVPIHVQPQFVSDYPSTNSQYSQIRSQYEMRSQIYPPQSQFSDIGGYVTRDVAFREGNLYGSTGSNPQGSGFSNPSQYVTIQQTPIPSQSTSPQPPYYAGVVLPPGQPYAQYSYSQYPQTVMNSAPYNSHATIYSPQPFGQQSPNTQRFSQEITQYQSQPIIQPISQNINHGISIPGTERVCRGPKPMVPPRINSKITHESGLTKTVCSDSTKQNTNNSVTGLVTETQHISLDGTEKRYVTQIDQNPRTRQDGLYVDTNTNSIASKDKTELMQPDNDIYRMRTDHDKVLPLNVSGTLKRRNDITFSKANDKNQEVVAERNTSSATDTKRLDGNQTFSNDQKLPDLALRTSPMVFDIRQDNRKTLSNFSSSVSPNQRLNKCPESRRSDYFEEQRRSPMIFDGKRFEEVRRSPMPFVSSRDSSTDRSKNNSSPFINQTFEKTRQELAMWAEQKQRQEFEKIGTPSQLYVTSPRSRNHSEERRLQSNDERKEARLSQSAFQPISNINQNTIIEQRRHLRHVSADLTKHVEFSKKEFDDQSLHGSVINVGSNVGLSSSQRASPNICSQYPTTSETKINTKQLLTVITDFNDKPVEQTDHIIHSHRKSHNVTPSLMTHSKSQSENISHDGNSLIEKTKEQQIQNQQCLDILSEKLTECERQQCDLQAKLQCLQNQNQILDKVAAYQQNDLQARYKSQVSPKDNHQFLNNSESDKMISHCQQHQSLLTTVLPQTSSEKLSPRLQVMGNGIPNISQLPLSVLPPIDRSEVTRSPFPHYHRSQFATDNLDNVMNVTAHTSSIGLNFTGTLKKIPPEKPPRTSLIIHSPESESNRSQPAIGLKQTPKARMDDHEIQSTVESILGPGVKVIDCEKKSCVQEEEVLLINGVPITLEGPDGVAIREAMITGQVPPCDLLNRILIRAGIQRVPVRLETSLSVKSSVVTKEEVTVARGGKVVDERSRETKENNSYSSSTSEIWEPVGIIHRPRNLKPFDSSDDSRPNSNASSDQGYTTCNTIGSNPILSERAGAAVGCPICESTDVHCARGCIAGLGTRTANVPRVPTTTSAPTIFGTVASDLNPKDGNSRRSLPQTPASGVGVKGLGGNSGSGQGPGLVNGSGEHQDIQDGAAMNTEHALVYRDGNLVSGSLEALVQHMVPTEKYYPDRAYLFAFLLSARLFIKPHELLGEVCALCEHQQNLTGEGGKERLHRFVPRLVQLLAEWTETFPYDFRDERVMSHVRSITQKVAAVDDAAMEDVSVLLKNLLLRLTALERYEEGLARLATEAATEQLSQVDITELCPSATVLAQQLTHVELERLSYIGPEEFVQAFAKESPHLETSFKDMKKTRNLESYVQWFNRLSYFVATEVCKHAKKKQRVRVVEYWIETARECFNIGNFNSLMAIIAGLNMSPISRLKKTWSKVQSAKFSILEHQMDPSSNFSSYRSTLKAAMWRSAGATDERQRIVVPFFSLLVKDLYFLNEGCSNKLPNGHINFEKFWQLAKQVTEFIAWKQVTCPFEKNPRVIAFLQASPILTENALALASFECEPPDNNPEKERYKALKSELNSQ